MKIASLLTLLMALTVELSAQAPTYNQEVLSKDGQQAFTILFHTRVFSLGGVGFSGQRSKSETSLIEFLKESDRVKALVYLTTNADAEGSLYALLGLKFISKQDYERQLPLVKALRVPDEVTFVVGCQIVPVKRADLLAGIESGAFDSRFVFWERDIRKP